MGMTMTQKILAKHAGVDSVKAGDLINCRLDLVMANDITAPPSIAEFKRIGVPVFDKEKIVLVPDHFQRQRISSLPDLRRSSVTSHMKTALSIISSRGVSVSSMHCFRKKAS